MRHTDVAHEVEGVEDDVSGPVTEGVFKSVDDLCALIDQEAFVRQRQAGDVATQVFEGAALVGMAHGANPQLHHSGGYAGRIPRAGRCEGYASGLLVATVCRVSALRPAWGSTAMEGGTVARSFAV